MVKLQIVGEDIKKMANKLRSISNQVKRTGKKSPRLAAEYMVIQARIMAPHKTGRMIRNINAFKRGRNSYEVLSHRFPLASESPRRDFPIHAWVDNRRNVGGWKKGPYSATNHTGTPGYFTKAAGKARYKFFKMVIRDVRKGLSIKI